MARPVILRHSHIGPMAKKVGSRKKLGSLPSKAWPTGSGTLAADCTGTFSVQVYGALP